MLDYQRLHNDLLKFAAEDWIAAMTALCREKLRDSSHGNLAEWREALNSLPDVGRHPSALGDPAVKTAVTWSDHSRHRARRTLLKLSPWRKGPFDIGGVRIDSEWRSDLKWERVRHDISPLADRRILDVGCGNGYYALRMLGDGAKFVLGIDPSVLFVVQFAAVCHFMTGVPAHVVPLRLHELPPDTPKFDSAFSMGVLYHQRDPAAHLSQMKETLRDDGELVLETLITPGEAADVVVPEERYARMRNVWHLPTVSRLEEWLGEAGFCDVRIIDQTCTTTEEQRTTEWMPFESLREALDPANLDKTVEGLPAPLRVVVTGRNRSD